MAGNCYNFCVKLSIPTIRLISSKFNTKFSTQSSKFKSHDLLTIRSMSQNNTTNDCYRPSASVIIAAKTEVPEDDYDYNALLFKRTPQTEYASDHCVFPGGSMDASDESIEWLKYFREFGITEHALQELIVVSDNRPQLLAPQGTGCYDRFFKKSRIWSRDISLRITALRETFEEVGVLLCRHRSNSCEFQNALGYVYEDFDREYWQRLVHNDASQFLLLCKELDVIPDLWCLQEWSVWRSPATANKKFETVFYFVALERIPNLLPETTEVALAMWHSPHTFLRKFEDQIIWLPFMVFYEVARLTNLRGLRELFKFAYQRWRNHGTSLLMPAFYHCSDSMVGILPGDDAYPPNPGSIREAIRVDATFSEFRKGISNVHRIVIRDMHSLHVDINIHTDGHLQPIKPTLKTSKL